MSHRTINMLLNKTNLTLILINEENKSLIYNISWNYRDVNELSITIEVRNIVPFASAQMY